MPALLLVKRRDQLGKQAPLVLTPSVHYCSSLFTPSGTLLCRYKRASFPQKGRIEEPQFLLILRFLKMRNLILLLLCLFGGHILGFTMSF